MDIDSLMDEWIESHVPASVHRLTHTREHHLCGSSSPRQGRTRIHGGARGVSCPPYTTLTHTRTHHESTKVYPSLPLHSSTLVHTHSITLTLPPTHTHTPVSSQHLICVISMLVTGRPVRGVLTPLKSSDQDRGLGELPLRPPIPQGHRQQWRAVHLPLHALTAGGRGGE